MDKDGYSKRVAIAPLLTLLDIPRMAGRRRLHSPPDCAARPRTVGRRRFAYAGGISAIRFIELVTSSPLLRALGAPLGHPG